MYITYFIHFYVESFHFLLYNSLKDLCLKKKRKTSNKFLTLNISLQAIFYNESLSIIKLKQLTLHLLIKTINVHLFSTMIYHLLDI